MGTSTSSRWDKRYRDSVAPGEPCWLLRQQQHLLPDEGRALDLACGLGANALLLASHGLDTQAWDSSSVALEKLGGFARSEGVDITAVQRDVERQPPPPASFDVIVVSRFLYRPLMPALVAALRPGGLLFYQTFHCHKRSSIGPSNPDYLLARGELPRHFERLQLLFYREDGSTGDPAQGLRDEAFFIGRRAA